MKRILVLGLLLCSVVFANQKEPTFLGTLKGSVTDYYGDRMKVVRISQISATYQSIGISNLVKEVNRLEREYIARAQKDAISVCYGSAAYFIDNFEIDVTTISGDKGNYFTNISFNIVCSN